MFSPNAIVDVRRHEMIFTQKPVSRFALLPRGPSSFIRPSQSEAVVYLENGLTKNHHILHEHPYRSGLQPVDGRKWSLRWLRVEFIENGLSEDHEILQLNVDNRPHQSAGNDVTRCYRSTTKCN